MVGITIRVKSVATPKPFIKATAIGLIKLEPQNAKGTNPMIVVVVLNKIGLSLLPAEFLHASWMDLPCFLSLLI